MNFKRFLVLVSALTLSLAFTTATLAAAAIGRQSSSPVVLTNHPDKGLPAARGQTAPAPPAPPAALQANARNSPARTPLVAGDWDGNGVRYPMVIQDGGTYFMWYTGNELFGPGRVGYATSPDGVTWTEHPGNPIMDAGDPGAWDADGVEAPFVIREGPSSYKMWYSGFPDCAIGYATSSDGLSWTRYAGNPVLTPGGDIWNNNCVIHPNVLFEGGLYKMWLLALGDDGGGQAPYIAYATSPDGITWTWDASNPLFGTTWENWIWRPDVLNLGGTYHMWYSLWDGEGRTSYAAAPDETTWTKYGSPVLSGTPGEWDEGTAIDPFVIEDSGLYTMWYDDGTAIGVVTSTNGITWTKNPANPVLLPGDANLYLDVNYAHDWVEGWTRAGETFYLTVTDGVDTYTVTGQADGNGWFGTYEWPWFPYNPDIQPGNTVQASAGGGIAEVDPVGTVHGQVDFAADTVSGTIDAPWFSPDPLTVRCEVWAENGPPGIDVPDVDPDGGSYLCDFSTVGWDLQPGQTIAVRYLEPDGDSVINVFESWMRVNYGHDWVGGNYEIGHTFWITVTDSGGAVKATAEIDTAPGQGWGSSGFETQPENWSPAHPDIQPYDWVYFQADDGYFNALRVGEISGTVDVDADSVGGPIYAGWFTQTLAVECHPWGAPGPAPSKNSSAEPDGSSPYFCQWDPLTEWDILPGQDIGVMYVEPDFDRVINSLREPAADMRVEKWAEGNGQAMPGGPVIFTIRYVNDGDAPSGAVYITDTLPVSTTYLTDTSGVAPAIGSGRVAWTLDPLDPGQEVLFRLVLLNSANPGETLHNAVDISTLYDFNFDNNHAEAEVFVTDEQPDLYVNKNPVPGDPAPGQTFLWEIDYGNNGPVASGPVVFTDTIPLSTTIVSWTSENEYGLWADASVTGDQLVLTAPVIPGGWGDRLLLRLQVEPAVAEGIQLTNTVAITTAGDTNPGDNWHLRDDVWTGAPRWDGHIDKTFNYGTLVPGGEIDYNVHVRNFGNMASQTWITDTLPEEASFAYAYLWVGQSSTPFPPDYVDDNIAYWDLGVLEPGDWRNISIHLDISDTAVPGTALTNCIEVVVDGNDSWPYDNESCVTDTVNEPGPNLRIKKNHLWYGEGRLHYEIYFENIGTTALYSTTITDTLPLSTSFTGIWWHWLGQEVQFADLGDRLVWTVSYLEPSWSAGLAFEVDLDGGIVGVPGLAFTNTAEAPVPGDVNPADNYAATIATTGPDIYVDKWLSGGLPRPGEIVTFTIEFGNQNMDPWYASGPSTITDVLPVEMTFLTATAPWDPSQSWIPTILPGNVLVWDWGDLCPNCLWRFDLVAQISETVEAREVLTNAIEMYSEDPGAVEWDYANNAATAGLTIMHPQFAIHKEFESARVAGMPVSYTLTVTNTGNWDDTGLVIHDLLPDYLTYTTGGTYDPGTGVISWTVASLAQGESAEVDFAGILACQAGVTVLNDTYSVFASDEGVSSPLGPPVSFEILAPTLSADFGQSASTIMAGETVTYTSQSTTNGTPIVDWAWDFGDGITATGETAAHAYAAPGVYQVTLTITDACGFTESLVVPDAVTVLQVGYEVFLPIITKDN